MIRTYYFSGFYVVVNKYIYMFFSGSIKISYFNHRRSKEIIHWEVEAFGKNLSVPWVCVSLVGNYHSLFLYLFSFVSQQKIHLLKYRTVLFRFWIKTYNLLPKFNHKRLSWYVWCQRRGSFCTTMHLQFMLCITHFYSCSNKSVAWKKDNVSDSLHDLFCIEISTSWLFKISYL
jgi:hypothetical protein